jgi:hypothetical protein
MLDLADKKEIMESPHLIIITASSNIYITATPFVIGFDKQYISDNMIETGALSIQEDQFIEGYK